MLQKAFEIFELPSGIRFVYKQISHAQVFHIGFFLEVGSRDELPNEHGIAHFWEHMAFKGTEKRKAWHIINRLESVGGELNAYTTKEKICFHASILADHAEKAVDLLTDITFRSVFPEKEIIKERTVITEEMYMYEDNPAEAIYDQFDELLFNDHTLGRAILGTPESVNSFKREDFLSFLKDTIDTQKLVISAVGPQSFKQAKKMIQKYLGDIPAMHSSRKRIEPTQYSPSKKEIEKPITQAHAIWGNRAFSNTDPLRIPFALLVNILGGMGMNSRLNMSLREKYGLVYAVDSTYSAYSDCGAVSIGFATDRAQLPRSLELVQKELKKLRETALTSRQLQAARQQLIGQLAMGEESNSGLMMAYGKSLMDFGSPETLDQIILRVNTITEKELQDLANEVFNQDTMSLLIYLPEKEEETKE